MKITIPDNWNEVTIKQLREIASIQTENKTRWAVECASILSDVDSEDIRKLNPTYLNQIASSLQFINELPKDNYNQSIKVNGNLYAVTDFNKMSLGQWIDIEEYGKDWKANLHKILAVIYLPATEEKGKLIIEPYSGTNGRELIMDNCSVAQVYGASVFFSTFALELLNISSLKALQKVQKDIRPILPLRKRLALRGHGMVSWIGSQVRGFSIWRKLQRKTH